MLWENKYSIEFIEVFCDKGNVKNDKRKGFDDDINENGDLADEICREDLWDEEILKKGNLNSVIGDKLREFKLKVGQAYEFY